MENIKNINNKQYISRLSAFIKQEYGIIAESITPARRGYYGETWQLNTYDKKYFIKIVSLKFHKPLYERSFPVLDYLCEQGVDFISKIVKPLQPKLYTNFEGATVGVFEWIDGDNVQNETSKIREYQMLSKIYAASKQSFDIPHESFSNEKAELFFHQWQTLESMPQDNTTIAILSLFEQNRIKFEQRAERLLKFSELCKTDTSHFYITHGDAGGNVIKNDDNFYIVDWDDPVYAPPERDAWFCMHWDWAMNAFNTSLKQNGIDYLLRPERLAYYCYSAFFWYLTLNMKIYFEIGNANGDFAKEISEYLCCWLEDNIKFADLL